MTATAQRRHTTLQFEPDAYIPKAGETILMVRALSQRGVAVTIHKIKAQRESAKQPGMILMQADVTYHDIANWHEFAPKDDEEEE